MRQPVREAVVVDASALVDLLVGTDRAGRVAARLQDCVWHAPAHVDAEVLSALGRLARADLLTEREVSTRLTLLAGAALDRSPLAPLLAGAWDRRGSLRLVDALYVELASQLDLRLVTTDVRLARATPSADAVG